MSKYTPEQVARAKNTLQRATYWRKCNPTAWDCIVRHALDLADKEQPIAAQALVESVRKKSFVDSHGNDTRTNNSYRTIFARWLVMEYPETKPYIKLRRSIYDCLVVPYGRG